MNILALDLGTNCGWAFHGESDCPMSGSQCFEPHKGECRGWKFIRFSVWLYGWQKYALDIVVCEKPIPFHAGQAASEIAYGMSTRVEEFCARQIVPFHLVNNAAVKKLATGNGRAEKTAMIRSAQILKSGVSDDNEADALWVLEYAKANFCNKFRRAS